MENDKSKPVAVHPGPLWIIALVLVCGAIIAYGQYYSKVTTNGLAYMLGSKLPLGLILCGVFYAALGRGLARPYAWISSAAILASVLASVLIWHAHQRVAAAKMVAAIRQDYASMMKSSADASGMAQPSKPLNAATSASGEFGEMERFTRNLMNLMAAQRNDYLRELAAIGWPGVIDWKRVQNDKDLVESRTIVRKAGETVSKYRAMTKTLFENARKSIQTLDIGEAAKQEMTKGFNRGAAKSLVQIELLWDLEAKSVAQFENIFALLADKNVAWEVKDGTLTFNKDSDLDVLKGYLDEVDRLTKQSEAIQQKGASNFNQTINKLAQ